MFPACRKRRVEASFDGGDVTSNGGVLLLRNADRMLGLTARVARGLGDGSQRGKVRHRLVDMLRQRVLAIALGYEDLNDHATLRHDLSLQTAADYDGALASAPTLCRFENRAEPRWAWLIHQVLVEVFIASFTSPPEEIVLDMDATDDAVHSSLRPIAPPHITRHRDIHEISGLGSSRSTIQRRCRRRSCLARPL